MNLKQKPFSPDQRPAVLFVCLGNICRSPTAEGVFRGLLAAEDLADIVQVDSAGTAAYHVGSPPDPRSIEAATARGYQLHELRARQVQWQDYHDFDYVLAMDNENLDYLRHQAPAKRKAKVGLLMEFGDFPGYQSVPDPYYGGDQGFELVLDLIESGCRGLLSEIKQRLP